MTDRLRAGASVVMAAIRCHSHSFLAASLLALSVLGGAIALFGIALKAARLVDRQRQAARC